MKAEVCILKTDRFTMDYCKFGEGDRGGHEGPSRLRDLHV